MLKKRRFKPYTLPGRSDWMVSFYHPVLKKTIGRGLNTTNQQEALQITENLRELCDIHQLIIESGVDDLLPGLSHFHSMAINIYFGKDSREAKKLLAFKKSKAPKPRQDRMREFIELQSAISYHRKTSFSALATLAPKFDDERTRALLKVFIELDKLWKEMRLSLLPLILTGRPAARKNIIDVLNGFEDLIRNGYWQMHRIKSLLPEEYERELVKSIEEDGNAVTEIRNWLEVTS